MILPIYLYGHPVLKRKCEEIPDDFQGMEELVDNMFLTMYNAKGVGLAAPQIGKPIRLFIVDTMQLKLEEGEVGIKKAFVNARKIEEPGEWYDYEEGCLSIPNVHGDVSRPEKIVLEYQDLEGTNLVETFTGMTARVIQHEYDHIEGELFVEKLKPLKRRRLKKKLENIKKGIVDCHYKVKEHKK